MARFSWCMFLRFEICLLMTSTCCVLNCGGHKTHSKSADSLVEVRAVFLNCVPDEHVDSPDFELARFQREELFKHDALQQCSKKLALTVKMTSAPQASKGNAKISDTDAAEEYIPIDHVFEGPNRKRVRLLNPYVLRLQREMPRQAYKLHRIDTVVGVLSKEDKNKNYRTSLPEEEEESRNRREIDKQEIKESVAINQNEIGKQTKSIFLGTQAYALNVVEANSDCGFKLFDNTSLLVNTMPSLKKRNARKVKQVFYPNASKISIASLKRTKRDSLESAIEHTPAKDEYSKKRYDYSDIDSEIQYIDGTSRSNDVLDFESEIEIPKQTNDMFEAQMTTQSYKEEFSKPSPLRKKEKPVTIVFEINDKEGSGGKDKAEPKYLHHATDEYKGKHKISFKAGKIYEVYEIGSADLWYQVHIQLFEKLSNPEGKTVWNDLTMGEIARISTNNPEWKRQDMYVRYKPAEWVPREDFTLPTSSRLCLLEPLQEANYTSDEDNVNENSNSEYIVVPFEDLVYKFRKPNVEKREKNISDDTTSPDRESSASKKEHSRVEVRTSRAIVGKNNDHFWTAWIGANKFLTLPHHLPHHSQIELEVKADDNQLVRVGNSGRLALIVVDGSRKTRSAIHVQATNTGLASSHFKVVVRECGPELAAMLNEKNYDEIVAGPILIPPQHTQRLRLDIPFTVPVETTRCNVVLLNDNDDSVAVREVKIKKGDRCFCVWHCDCVCLGEDSKLLCREMSDTQQVAAGLSIAERPRYTRSICYHDYVTLNFCSCAICIVMFLVFLGFIKGTLGICSPYIGQLGFEYILKFPRRLRNDRYYESQLSGIPVVYDKYGWAVRPDTGERTVRIVGCRTQFILNLVLFIVMPYMIQLGLLKAIYNKIANCGGRVKNKISPAGVNLNSPVAPQDVQNKRMKIIVRAKSKARVLPWMSPSAEEITKDVLQRVSEENQNTMTGLPRLKSAFGLLSAETDCCADCDWEKLKRELRPLLYEANKSEISMADSEEDTYYVLTQMQKSKESLARSQRKVNDSNQSAEKSKTPPP